MGSHQSSTIAFYLVYFGGGGAERVLINLASGFVEQGYQVDFVLGNAWGRHIDKIPPELTVVDLKAKGNLGNIWHLSKYLQKKQPKALIAGMHFANEIAIVAKMIARTETYVIVTEHNTLTHSLNHNKNKKKRAIPFTTRYLYPQADRIVTVSQGATVALAKVSGLDQTKIDTIYNPVITPELFQKATIPLEHPWFQAGEPPIILGVGKLEAQKDFSTLIRAFNIVRKKINCRLVILGWGPDLETLQHLIEELGIQEDSALMGYVDNPYPFMVHAAVFTLSSAWEGLPTVLIEALALGKPVISTDCPSGPREILDDGRYGVLVPVGDPQRLADEIYKVLTTPPQHNMSDWLKQFSLENSVRNYLNLIEN